MDEEIVFLSFADVMAIHNDQLARYGGREGFISESGVHSATDAPSAMWSGRFLHEDLAHMAAAYLCGFADAQHFTDGNKRTAAACCNAFLQLNGYEIGCAPDELYELTMGVANKQMDKDGAASWIRARIVAVIE